ncbi:MAG: hypothetical protein ACR2QG_13705 [Gammaproteobacteria bacterium]
MLDLMLGNADDAFSTGEIFAYFRPFREHHFDPECSCGEMDCEVWRGLLDVPEEHFHANIFRQTDTNLVVDSSKDLRWVYDSNVWAQKNKLDCFNVVIWKDPIDLAYSYWKRDYGIKYYREAFLVYYERLIGLGLPFISINYNQLASDPVSVLKMLCDRTGLQMHQGQERFWEKRHHYFFGSAGTAKQVDKGGSRIENARDFPQDFLREYEAESNWSDSNQQFQNVLKLLAANDLTHAAPAHQASIAKGLMPIWYYRHIFKSFWRKRFPETWQVVE